MSEDQLQQFLRVVAEDQMLQEKLKQASDFEAVIATAQEAGYDISQADLTRYQESRGAELGDQELEQVAGGAGDIGAQIFGCLVLLSLKSQDCKWEKN